MSELFEHYEKRQSGTCAACGDPWPCPTDKCARYEEALQVMRQLLATVATVPVVADDGETDEFVTVQSLELELATEALAALADPQGEP